MNNDIQVPKLSNKKNLIVTTFRTTASTFVIKSVPSLQHRAMLITYNMGQREKTWGPAISKDKRKILACIWDTLKSILRQ